MLFIITYPKSLVLICSLYSAFQDLWNLGRCIGVHGFGKDYDREAKKMDRELRAANTNDRKRLKSGDRAKNLILATVKGDQKGQVSTFFFLRDGKVDRRDAPVICRTRHPSHGLVC